VGSGWAIAPIEAGPKCKAAAETALAIDSSVAEAHRELGGYYLFYAWDLASAGRELKAAIELNPGNPISHEVYGYYFFATGALDDALREHQASVRLNPVSLISNVNVGDAYYYQRRYGAAIEQYRKTLELEPNFAVGREHLGRTLVQQRRFAEGISELDIAARREPQPWTIASLAYGLAAAGRANDAKRLLVELRSASSKRFVSPAKIATVYIGLQEPDQAMEWLERAYQQRDDVLVWVKCDPVFDPLRSHPRFKDLVNRLKLP
jgi:tetratricopeptide (TPR) repeat protein